MAGVWSDLLFFESRDLASRHYRQLHGHKLSAEKASEILANFAQARGYFESAKNADDLVRPLLLYYGVTALARSLVLFLNPTMRETSMKPAHGLRQIDWAQTLTEPAADIATRVRRLPNIKIGFCGGTFEEFADATANVERSFVHVGPFPSKMWLTRERPLELPPAAELTLQDILSRLPELADRYERAFESVANCFMAIVFAIDLEPNNMGNGFQVDFSIYEKQHAGLPTPDVIRRAFGLGDDIEIRERETSNWIDLRNQSFRITYPSKEAFRDQLPHISLDPGGHTFLVPPTDGGFAFSKMLLLFMASYMFGMLARYFPSYWLALLNRSEGDFMRPVVQEAIVVIEEEFPKHVLNELENRVR